MTSTDTYYEGVFTGLNEVQGKGVMVLNNGDRITGTFDGTWADGIKISSGVYTRQSPDHSVVSKRWNIVTHIDLFFIDIESRVTLFVIFGIVESSFGYYCFMQHATYYNICRWLSLLISLPTLKSIYNICLIPDIKLYVMIRYWAALSFEVSYSISSLSECFRLID